MTFIVIPKLKEYFEMWDISNQAAHGSNANFHMWKPVIADSIKTAATLAIQFARPFCTFFAFTPDMIATMYHGTISSWHFQSPKKQTQHLQIWCWTKPPLSSHTYPSV
jgi:hypothetical protein